MTPKRRIVKIAAILPEGGAIAAILHDYRRHETMAGVWRPSGKVTGVWGEVTGWLEVTDPVLALIHMTLILFRSISPRPAWWDLMI
jgi:hypothetical protein